MEQFGRGARFVERHADAPDERYSLGSKDMKVMGMSQLA